MGSLIVLDASGLVILIDIKANLDNLFICIDRNNLQQTGTNKDIMDIHFQDEFFDISLCLGVLQHTPDTSKSIRELTRVLKKGGKLVFLFPTRNLK